MAFGLGRTLFGPTNAGTRPTVHRMNRPDYWLGKFSKLRVDRARGDPAPRPPAPDTFPYLINRVINIVQLIAYQR